MAVSKLYVVVRRDLRGVGPTAAQLLHAGVDLARSKRHDEVVDLWHRTSNTVAVVTVANEAELKELEAQMPPDRFVSFREPDLDKSLTSLAAIDPPRRLVKDLPLLGA